MERPQVSTPHRLGELSQIPPTQLRYAGRRATEGCCVQDDVAGPIIQDDVAELLVQDDGQRPHTHTRSAPFLTLPHAPGHHSPHSYGQHTVGDPHGRTAVRDEHCGGAGVFGEESLNRLEDDRLVEGIELAGWLIEEDHARITQEYPG